MYSIHIQDLVIIYPGMRRSANKWGGSRYRFFMLAGMLLLFSFLHKNVQIHIK